MTGYGQTYALLVALTALCLGCGYYLGGRAGLELAMAFALATNLVSWFFSGRLILWFYNAQEVTERTAPELLGMVRALAARAELPTPKVYVIPSAQPNAFATGRNPANGVVAVTSGLIQRLDRQQLAGVIGHELAHIRNYDMLIMSVTATIVGVLSFLSRHHPVGAAQRDERDGGWIPVVLLLVAAPVAALIIQLAISRSREYQADSAGATICGNPLWLARALATIHQDAGRLRLAGAEANPATAHLFIINPLGYGWIGSLFSTHPPVEERIRRLEQLAGGRGPAVARALI